MLVFVMDIGVIFNY